MGTYISVTVVMVKVVELISKKFWFLSFLKKEGLQIGLTELYQFVDTNPSRHFTQEYSTIYFFNSIYGLPSIHIFFFLVYA